MGFPLELLEYCVRKMFASLLSRKNRCVALQIGSSGTRACLVKTDDRREKNWLADAKICGFQILRFTYPNVC